ncbi:hypothetical protein [Hymenobacter glacieicola]|uniref:STAS/SEC14 domain-containing protein n=1 Tax=Hymenobacter glacieicola TaxID=1562124 RepID=A0ABQ1WZE8_9BACT|nr:hypothetical protein [Hymenobacter glacieicola]GGG46748.1 hypothetical protein GCM10011378_23700 [Hymenobacter glacieicola]
MPSAPPPTAADYVEFHRRDELGVLIIRWTRPVSAAELQQSYEAALTLARPASTRYWLADSRGRGPASEDDTHWVLTQFMPRVAAVLHGRVYLAFLVSAAQLSPEEQQTGSPMVFSDLAHVRLFATEEAAIHWLHSRQHLDSA